MEAALSHLHKKITIGFVSPNPIWGPAKYEIVAPNESPNLSIIVINLSYIMQ